jgi:hypothetical protein
MTIEIPLWIIIIVLLLLGAAVNAFINDDSPSGYLDFNIFKGMTKKAKRISLIVVGIIFPPSLVVSVLCLLNKYIHKCIVYIVNKFIVLLKLDICKYTVYDDHVLTKCGAHVSKFATKCPICNKPFIEYRK